MSKEFAKKHIVDALLIVLLALSNLFIIGTFSKYKDSIMGNASIAVAKWNINVNDDDLNSNSIFTNTMHLDFEENSYVQSGLIAPNSEGFIEININPQDTQTAYEFKIVVRNDNPSLPYVRAVGYTINNGSRISYENFATGVGEVNENTSVRIYVKWLNDEESNLIDNSNMNTLLTFPVEVEVSQYVL